MKGGRSVGGKPSSGRTEGMAGKKVSKRGEKTAEPEGPAKAKEETKEKPKEKPEDAAQECCCCYKSACVLEDGVLDIKVAENRDLKIRLSKTDQATEDGTEPGTEAPSGELGLPSGDDYYGPKLGLEVSPTADCPNATVPDVSFLAELPPPPSAPCPFRPPCQRPPPPPVNQPPSPSVQLEITPPEKMGRRGVSNVRFCYKAPPPETRSERCRRRRGSGVRVSHGSESGSERETDGRFSRPRRLSGGSDSESRSRRGSSGYSSRSSRGRSGDSDRRRGRSSSSYSSRSSRGRSGDSDRRRERSGSSYSSRSSRGRSGDSDRRHWSSSGYSSRSSRGRSGDSDRKRGRSGSVYGSRSRERARVRGGSECPQNYVGVECPMSGGRGDPKDKRFDNDPVGFKKNVYLPLKKKLLKCSGSKEECRGYDPLEYGTRDTGRRARRRPKGCGCGRCKKKKGKPTKILFADPDPPTGIAVEPGVFYERATLTVLKLRAADPEGTLCPGEELCPECEPGKSPCLCGKSRKKSCVKKKKEKNKKCAKKEKKKKEVCSKILDPTLCPMSLRDRPTGIRLGGGSDPRRCGKVSEDSDERRQR